MIPAPQPNFPGGYTWVFQGTVAEDATGGTHVCSLTVTPGVGNEFQVIGGRITEGNTATSQTALVNTNDGTNTLNAYIFVADTSGNIIHEFPVTTIPATNTSNGMTGTCAWFISGGMNLVLRVTTTAVSVTQTFSLVCRMKNPVKPTATLADSVGTPTLTTNTNALFTT